MSEPCKNCDRPIATDADWEHYHDCADDGCTYGADLCWDQPCVREPVDWCERALAAEARIAAALALTAPWVKAGVRQPCKRCARIHAADLRRVLTETSEAK